MTKFQRSVKEAMSGCCLGIAEAEVRLNFPLLRLNYSTEADRTIAAFQTLQPEERLQTALALATLGEERSKPQSFLVEAFRVRKGAHSLAVLDALATTPLSTMDGAVQSVLDASDAELACFRRASNPLSKSAIKRCFLEQLRSRYERKIVSLSSSECECVTQIGTWQLVTDFDFGGSFQFRFGILLRHEDLPAPTFRGGATLGSLLGLGDFGWDTLVPETLEQGAESAVALCNELRARLSAAALKVKS